MYRRLLANVDQPVSIDLAPVNPADRVSSTARPRDYTKVCPTYYGGISEYKLYYMENLYLD